MTVSEFREALLKLPQDYKIGVSLSGSKFVHSKHVVATVCSDIETVLLNGGTPPAAEGSFQILGVDEGDNQDG